MQVFAQIFSYMSRVFPKALKCYEKRYGWRPQCPHTDQSHCRGLIRL